MDRPYRALSRPGCAIALLTLTQAACSILPAAQSSAPTARPGTQSDGGGSVAAPNASSALLAQSRSARSAGDFVGAAAALDRALRIEPNDPVLWLEYGELRLAEGDFEQAESLARKASSLAGDDPRTRAAADRLISNAQRASGSTGSAGSG